MPDVVVAARWQFAFTIMFHYLFPVLNDGIGVLIAALKTIELRTGNRHFGTAARFWARIFAISLRPTRGCSTRWPPASLMGAQS